MNATTIHLRRWDGPQDTEPFALFTEADDSPFSTGTYESESALRESIIAGTDPLFSFDAVKGETDDREVVCVGWDGGSQPMYRFRDELHLPDHLRRIVR